MSERKTKQSNLEKISVANTLTLEALILLLESKGIVTTQEIINLIRKIKENGNEIVN